MVNHSIYLFLQTSLDVHWGKAPESRWLRSLFLNFNMVHCTEMNCGPSEVLEGIREVWRGRDLNSFLLEDASFPLSYQHFLSPVASRDHVDVNTDSFKVLFLIFFFKLPHQCFTILQKNEGKCVHLKYSTTNYLRMNV